MKISDKHEIRDLRKGNQAVPEKSRGAGLFSLFSSELNARQGNIAEYDKNIEQLRIELDEAGQSLEREPTLQNFRKFRDLLSRIAKQVSKEAYRLEKIGGTATNPRYYEIITIIDKEADKLYELVVKGQKERMDITASVIGIKGLVVDLLT